MTSVKSCETNEITQHISKIIDNIAVTRRELHNLRKDLRCLNHCYQKDIDHILNSLKTWKCESCESDKESLKSETIASSSIARNDSINFRPIGVVTTSFHEKRAIPRQAGVCPTSQGKLTVFNSIFTNPDHALEGLEEFSHMWILFHFHKNDSTHVRAKVAPPRLNGLKTGVFGTRSPHRPSPIGLSLVHIDYISGSSVYFSGVDMLDNTPVLDIKPYIPLYDNPTVISQQQNAENQMSSDIGGSDSELIDQSCIPREAPDGEEDDSSNNRTSTSSVHMSDQVRVPQWVTKPNVSQLTVMFKDKARQDLEILKSHLHETDSSSIDDQNDVETSITRILQEDPRSVYIRERYGNQFYTFLMGRYHVSCKFNDHNHSVQVYKVSRANSLQDSNEPTSVSDENG